MNTEETFALDPKCVQLQVKAADWQDAIRNTCKPLLDNGYVLPGYPADVIEREMQWATGLPTMPFGVAIPHALKPDNVVSAKVAASLLAEPVSFKQSGGTEEDSPVEAKIVFVLALKDSSSQLSLLQNLMVAISDEDMLTALAAATTPEEFCNIFNGCSTVAAK